MNVGENSFRKYLRIHLYFVSRIMDKVIKEKSNLQLIFAKDVLKVGAITSNFLILPNIIKSLIVK